MKNRFVRYLTTLAFSITVIACSRFDNNMIELNTDQEELNLSHELLGDWERVCVLMPYVSMESASETLGFSFNPTLYSRIDVMDDRTLLVTTKANQVFATYEVARDNIDFTQIGPRFFVYNQARFTLIQQNGAWFKLKPVVDQDIEV